MIWVGIVWALAVAFTAYEAFNAPKVLPEEEDQW